MWRYPSNMWSVSLSSCHVFPPGHVPLGRDGSSWRREDGHLKETAEQIQPHQHDLPTGIQFIYVPLIYTY